MKTIWLLRGKLAGTFQQVGNDEATRLIDKGDAQLADGVTPLRYPENHPQYTAPRRARKKTTARKKYPNKMMTTDAEA